MQKHFAALCLLASDATTPLVFWTNTFKRFVPNEPIINLPGDVTSITYAPSQESLLIAMQQHERDVLFTLRLPTLSPGWLIAFISGSASIASTAGQVSLSTWWPNALAAIDCHEESLFAYFPSQGLSRRSLVSGELIGETIPLNSLVVDLRSHPTLPLLAAMMSDGTLCLYTYDRQPKVDLTPQSEASRDGLVFHPTSPSASLEELFSEFYWPFDEA